MSGFRSARGSAFKRALVIAFFIRTGDHRSFFADSLHQVFMPAIRTFLGNGFPRGRELALRVIPAAVKRIALARAFFDEFAFFAFGTLHADEILLHIFAVGDIHCRK